MQFLSAAAGEMSASPRGGCAAGPGGRGASSLLVSPAKKNPLSLNLKEVTRSVWGRLFQTRCRCGSPAEVAGGARRCCGVAGRGGKEAPRNLLPEPVRLSELRVRSGETSSLVCASPPGDANPLPWDGNILDGRLLQAGFPARPSGGARQALLCPSAAVRDTLVLQGARGFGVRHRKLGCARALGLRSRFALCDACVKKHPGLSKWG